MNLLDVQTPLRQLKNQTSDLYTVFLDPEEAT